MSAWKRNRLRVLRAERRWTQTRLAARLHVHQGTVSLWENAAAEPTAAEKVKLARAFGLADPSDLLKPEALAS